MFIPLSLRRAACAAVLVTPALVAACGARGPLDVIIVVEEQPEAGADVSPSEDAPASPIDSATDDAGPVGVGFDAAPLVNCGSCLAQHCGMQLYSCFASTTCRTTLQCAATKCLSGGMPNPQCVLTCANGDTSSLTQLVGVFGCVLGNCGSQCTSVLGGLGGGGGFGGGGG
jgi:hypothetical protein